MTDTPSNAEPTAPSDGFGAQWQPPAPQPPQPGVAPLPPSPYQGAPVPPAPYSGAPLPPAPLPPPVSVPPKRKRRIASLSAVAVAVVVIGLKIAAGFGIGWAVTESKHGASDAEHVVQTAMQADTQSVLIATFATGTSLDNLADTACTQAFQQASKFTIPSSKKNSDGTANVQMRLNGVDTKFTFHLVKQDGWKIVRLTCG